MTFGDAEEGLVLRFGVCFWGVGLQMLSVPFHGFPDLQVCGWGLSDFGGLDGGPNGGEGWHLGFLC